MNPKALFMIISLIFFVLMTSFFVSRMSTFSSKSVSCEGKGGTCVDKVKGCQEYSIRIDDAECPALEGEGTTSDRICCTKGG